MGTALVCSIHTPAEKLLKGQKTVVIFMEKLESNANETAIKQISLGNNLWHDRAVFHFLREENTITKYLKAAGKGIRKGGYLILGTFSEKGPETCSGLLVNRYSLKQMQDLFSPSFTYLRGINVDHQTPSGNVQNYNFALFQKK